MTWNFILEFVSEDEIGVLNWLRELNSIRAFFSKSGLVANHAGDFRLQAQIDHWKRR